MCIEIYILIAVAIKAKDQSFSQSAGSVLSFAVTPVVPDSLVENTCSCSRSNSRLCYLPPFLSECEFYLSFAAVSFLALTRRSLRRQRRESFSGFASR